MILQFSLDAIDDLIEIGNYIKQDNPARGESFIDALKECCAQFLDHPRMGRDRSELKPNLRSWPFGKYFIFYEPFDERIYISRVIHTFRDVEAIFNPN